MTHLASKRYCYACNWWQIFQGAFSKFSYLLLEGDMCELIIQCKILSVHVTDCSDKDEEGGDVDRKADRNARARHVDELEGQRADRLQPAQGEQLLPRRVPPDARRGHDQDRRRIPQHPRCQGLPWAMRPKNGQDLDQWHQCLGRMDARVRSFSSCSTTSSFSLFLLLLYCWFLFWEPLSCYILLIAYEWEDSKYVYQ